jgi:hypothetical protein
MWDDYGKQTCDYCGKIMSASDITPGIADYDICTECTSDSVWGDEIQVRDDHCTECGTWSTVEAKSGLCIICFVVSELDNQ